MDCDSLCVSVSLFVQVRFFDLRLTFLLTALRVDVRVQLARNLHGISLLGNCQLHL